MADPIFFQSANRFLAASPSGDFSLYGAQPTVQLSPAATTPDAAAPREAISEAELRAPTVDPQLDATEARIADLTGDFPRGGSSTPAAPIAFQSDDAAAPAHLASTPLNPFDLRPIVLTDLEDRAAPAAHHAGDHVADWGAAAPADPASVLTAPVIDTVEPVAGTTIGTVVGVVEPVVDGVTGVLGDTVDTVIGAVAPLLDTIGDTVGGTLDTVTGLVGGTVEGLGQTVEGVATPLLTTLGEVGHVADDLPVTDLLGSDPAGGIATLVNLVNVTDLLDLRDAGAPGDGGPADAADPVGGLLDTLTADLTDFGHHDGSAAADHDSVIPNQNLLGDLLGDHHHDGGLGLGLGG